ncbi:MAG: hypothetical protein L6V93_02040 [Clostridiales bacterium]|nr:MAG: hypothetical protein L6V93_02040 [Clostridiales bacterium]
MMYYPKSGTALFVSIAGDAYTDEVKKELKSAFTRAASNTTASKAIDWIENMLPQRWNSIFLERTNMTGKNAILKNIR